MIYLTFNIVYSFITNSVFKPVSITEKVYMCFFGYCASVWNYTVCEIELQCKHQVLHTILVSINKIWYQSMTSCMIRCDDFLCL